MKLIKSLVLLLAAIHLLTILLTAIGPQRSRQLRIEGCYTDTELIEDEGVVVGSGTLTIKKNSGKYVGTFVQLLSDGGGDHAPVTLENLVINPERRTISFTLRVFVAGGRTKAINARGTINSRGIRLRFSEDLFDYGRPNPLMRKVACQK